MFGKVTGTHADLPDPNGGYCFHTIEVDRLQSSSIAFFDGDMASVRGANADALWMFRYPF